MRILLFISLLSISVCNVSSSDDCLVTKRQKKQPTKDLKIDCVMESKNLIREISRLLQLLGMITEETIEVLDEEFQGKTKQELEAHLKKLEDVYRTVEKCENDIYLLMQNNKKMLQKQTGEGK